jgi:hypothetical protein
MMIRLNGAVMLRAAVFASLMGVGLLMAGSANAAGPPAACAVLSEKQAVALAGGPLGAVVKQESMPADDNGHDHTTKCGYFPKGYDVDKADGPPERGIMITLHAMPDSEAAKRFYEQLFSMAGRSIASVPGARIAPASGLGEAAYVQLMTLDSNPPVQLANVGFFKGSVMGFMRVWLKRPPGDTARDAARQVISGLP